MTSPIGTTVATELEPHDEDASPGTSPDAPSGRIAAIPPVMRAITYGAFGSPDVLRLGEVAVPRPGAGQVLVRIRAVAVNPWDWHFMRGLPYLARLNGAGIRRPAAGRRTRRRSRSAPAVLVVGIDWVRAPSVGPALAIGLGTIVAPWLVMQPGMGAGLAGSRTPNPAATRLRNLATHAVYGLGLYLAATALAVVWA